MLTTSFNNKWVLAAFFLLAVSIPSSNSFFILDFLGSILNARNAVNGFSYALSVVKMAVKVFTLLNPTTGVIQVLRGRREIISKPGYAELESAFTSATLSDRMECLPMVLCAIYADPDDLVTPVESKFKKAFRSLFSESYTPVWAAKYVKATEVGESSTSDTQCQDKYSSCTFSPKHLRRLINEALNTYLYNSNDSEEES